MSIGIRNQEHGISQFADYTAAYNLNHFNQEKRLLDIVSDWEQATAMRANRAKAAIIPVGKSAREAHGNKHEVTRKLRELGLPGPSEEEWDMYLGSPIASDKKVYKAFLEQKCLSMKKKLANWKGLSGLTIHGRTMVAQTHSSSLS